MLMKTVGDGEQYRCYTLLKLYNASHTLFLILTQHYEILYILYILLMYAYILLSPAYSNTWNNIDNKISYKYCASVL